jgi:hypothetical protein
MGENELDDDHDAKPRLEFDPVKSLVDQMEACSFVAPACREITLTVFDVSSLSFSYCIPRPTCFSIPPMAIL